MTHLIISGHFKGSKARIIPGQDLASERWRDSVLVVIENRWGRTVLRRVELENLVEAAQFLHKSNSATIQPPL